MGGLSDLENIKNTVAEETSYTNLDNSVIDGMEDNTTSRKTHTCMYVLGQPSKPPLFDVLSGDENMVAVPLPKFKNFNQLPSFKSRVLEKRNFKPVKSFMLDIELLAIPGKSAKEIAICEKIFVNDEIRKVNSCSDWKVIIKKIPVDFSKLAVEFVFSKFEKIVSIKMQLIGLWQKALVKYESSEVASSVASKWCINNIEEKRPKTSDNSICLLYTSNTSITLCNLRPHAPKDLNSAIQHAKRYEMAMEETNHTKLVNLAIEETSSVAEEKIDQLTKKPIPQLIQQQYQQPPTQHYQVPARKLTPQNQFTSQNRYQVNNNRISSNNQLVPQNSAQPRPNHYHTQPSYLTIPKEQNFHYTALLEGRAAAQQQNSSYTPITIPPARIAENANFSDIFPFEFEANESPFLLSNAAANEQKAITAMYTEAEAEEKPIHLILDSGSVRSIITYQLMQQLKKNVNQSAQTVIVTTDGIKKTPVGEIDNFPFTLDGITISVKYQALVENDWLQKANAKLDWETQELQISYQRQHAQVPATCGTFNKCFEKADKTEQEHFTPHSEPETPGWNIPYLKPEPRKQCLYIPLKCKDCHKKLSSMGACISPEEEYENHTCYYCKACHRKRWSHLIKKNMLLKECNWIDVTMKRGVCNQTCQYALSISEKVKRGTPFNAAYNSALNKLYYYPHDAEMIFNLAMALINEATKEDICQMKEAEYIEYTMELAGFDYEDEVKIYHQIAKQMNIRLCEKCIMPCDEQWCPECYAFRIPLSSKSNENKIEFGEPKTMEEIETTPIYLIKNQPALQLKYFNNNGQGIKPEKAHEINAGYDLRYSDKDTLVLKPKSLTKINLKIAHEIPLGAMVQIVSWSSLASKKINVRGEIINAEYTGDITVMLQNETNKPFKINHAEKIAQAIYLLLINISGLQLVNQREKLGKSDRGTQGFVPVNIALNTQNESHQILRLPQPITILPFGEHPKIYTCPKPTTTQQIFESNKQVCLEHNILISNIYIPERTKKVRVTFYNPNNYPIVLLNNLEIGVIHSNIFQQKLPQTVTNFLEIIGHSLSKINPNPSSENYYVGMEKLSRINMGQLESQQ
ncbi:hypothetical protein G9A89_014860 [Geosiphon pyriformis]|nr:hypothetical protein G9A89_014860 [Geosiphon pyriformis]